MKHLFLVIALSVFRTSLDQTPDETNNLIFGIRVSYAASGEMVTYTMFHKNGSLKQHQRKLSRDEFIKFASGYWPSPYNYKRYNYFEQFGINCGVIVDSITRKEYCDCPPLDSLWKIHFARWPFSYNVEGWAGRNHLPSLKQNEFLFERYGIANIDQNYFSDTSCWLILRDVSDPTWISGYLSLR